MPPAVETTCPAESVSPSLDPSHLEKEWGAGRTTCHPRRSVLPTSCPYSPGPVLLPATVRFSQGGPNKLGGKRAPSNQKEKNVYINSDRNRWEEDPHFVFAKCEDGDVVTLKRAARAVDRGAHGTAPPPPTAPHSRVPKPSKAQRQKRFCQIL